MRPGDAALIRSDRIGALVETAARVASIDGGTAQQKGVGLGGAAIVLQRAEQRIQRSSAVADFVPIHPIHKVG